MGTRELRFGNGWEDPELVMRSIGRVRVCRRRVRGHHHCRWAARSLRELLSVLVIDLRLDWIVTLSSENHAASLRWERAVRGGGRCGRLA